MMRVNVTFKRFKESFLLMTVISIVWVVIKFFTLIGNRLIIKILLG